MHLREIWEERKILQPVLLLLLLYCSCFLRFEQTSCYFYLEICASCAISSYMHAYAFIQLVDQALHAFVFIDFF
uniref:Uncharacterized protein n=1 Tax=Aegilops tauschii subsp. strangulata TaxID=200361 RepID=A0A453E361_AEGTS